MAWLRLDGHSRGWSVAFVDGYHLGEHPIERYEKMAGLSDAGLSVTEALANASFDIRRDFHTSLPDADQRRRCDRMCYLYVMHPRLQGRGISYPLAEHVAGGPSYDGRVMVCLVHRDCPKADSCVQNLVEAADIRIRHPDEYDSYRQFEREARELMKRIVRPFEEPAETALSNLRDDLGMDAVMEAY